MAASEEQVLDSTSSDDDKSTSEASDDSPHNKTVFIAIVRKRICSDLQRICDDSIKKDAYQPKRGKAVAATKRGKIQDVIKIITKRNFDNDESCKKEIEELLNELADLLDDIGVKAKKGKGTTGNSVRDTNAFLSSLNSDFKKLQLMNLPVSNSAFYLMAYYLMNYIADKVMITIKSAGLFKKATSKIPFWGGGDADQVELAKRKEVCQYLIKTKMLISDYMEEPSKAGKVTLQVVTSLEALSGKNLKTCLENKRGFAMPVSVTIPGLKLSTSYTPGTGNLEVAINDAIESIGNFSPKPPSVDPDGSSATFRR